jgi:outer membrane protein OmpA-like peptidoglycan-associated protein
MIPETLSRLTLLTTVGATLWLAGCQSAPRKVPDAPPAVEGSAPGPAYGKPAPGTGWSPTLQTARGQLESRLKGTGVTVDRSSDNRLWITLPGDQSFEANRSALKPAARSALDQVAVVTGKIPNMDVRIVGHTDSKGSVAANNALSLDRAASTRDWLVARGFSPVRIAVAGRGAQDPVGSNDTDTGRAANRRVEILIGERSTATPSPAAR